MTLRRRSALLVGLLAFAVVVTLAITTGQRAHASAISATRVATVSLHDTRTVASVSHAPAHPLKWYMLKWAETQAGKPYAWGGSGPGSYDCSGLVMAAWAHYGKALPHNVASMLASGRLYRISAGKRGPGDLVVWGNFHVEIVTLRGTFGAHSSGTLVGWARYWGTPTFWRVR
jgi:cell wall-associated NlpC family hydrolase